MHLLNKHPFVQQSKFVCHLCLSNMIYSSVIEQVQNRKLTTFSLDYLNKIFIETEAQVL
jgi:hypothetical protein